MFLLQPAINQKIWNRLPLISYLFTLHFMVVFGGRLLLMRAGIEFDSFLPVLQHISSSLMLWAWMVATNFIIILAGEKEHDLKKRRMRLFLISCIFLAIAMILFGSVNLMAATTMFTFWTGTGWLNRPLEKYDIVKTFYVSLILIIVVLVMGYFLPFTPDEQIYFSTVSVLMLIMHLVTFSMFEGRRIFLHSALISGVRPLKQWALLQGIIWGSVLLIFGTAIILIKGLDRTAGFLFTLADRLALFLAEALYRFFLLFQNHERLAEISEGNGNQNNDRYDSSQMPELDISQEGAWTDTINRIFDIFAWIVIILIILWLLRIIWYRFNHRSSSTSELIGVKRRVLSAGNGSFNDIHQQMKMTGNYAASIYSDSIHPVRRTFKKFLKELRKKKMWTSSDTTVSRLEKEFSVPAVWYERVRYGGQDLTDEEVRQYQDKMKQVLKSLKNKGH